MRRRILSLLLSAALTICLLPAEAVAAPGEFFRTDSGGVPVTSRSFLAGIGRDLSEGETLSLLKEDGAPVSPDALVATGQTLEARDANGALLFSREVVVAGDALGTGEAGPAQTARLARALCGAEPLEGARLAAGDVNGSGTTDLADVVASARLAAPRNPDAPDMSPEEFDVYSITRDEPSREEFWFADGDRDIPFLSLEAARGVLEDALGEEYVPGGADGIMTLEKDGAVAEFNFFDGTIVFSDYDAFFLTAAQATCLDPVDEERAFLKKPDGSFERAGKPVRFDLKSYSVPMYWKEGRGYLPLQTFSDLFLSAFGCRFLYNGRAVFLTSYYLDDLEELYYDAPTGERDEELARFTYNELCLALDALYGLKSQHDISSFGALFEQTGLKEKLLSPDPLEADKALSDLTYGYLGDQHSALMAPSWLAGADAIPMGEVVSESVYQGFADERLFSAARERFYPDGVPAYEEIGDTAFITVDVFAAGEEDYAPDRPLSADSEDIVDIVRYAHARITREGSPVENVVLDLSLNSGGAADAALFVVSWFLGTATLNLNSSLTGAQASTRYMADVNLDGRADENDTVSSKNLYCLISPCSFSAGNLAPALFRSSGKVAVVGMKSGGGACIVAPLGAADGSILSLSGPRRVSTVENGSFYDVDRGVEPEVLITRVEHFYDREALAARLGALYR